MNNKTEILIHRLLRRFNIFLIKDSPRHSVRFAKEYFKDKPIIAVEIGTSMGRNALSMLKELNIEKIYLIDPYEKYEDYLKSEPIRTQNNLSSEKQLAHKLLERYKDKIVWVEKYSDDGVKDIPQADFIYIDGNHEYEYVKKDIENYLPKVKKGGIIAGHDVIHPEFSPLIFRALMETLGRNKLYPHSSVTDWWVVKV